MKWGSVCPSLMPSHIRLSEQASKGEQLGMHIAHLGSQAEGRWQASEETPNQAA